MHLIKRPGIAVVAVGMSACLVGGMSPASASATAPPSPSSVSSSAAAPAGDEATIEEIAQYLRSVDADKLVDAEGQFDYEFARAEFGTEFADSFRTQWEANANGGVVTAPGLESSPASTPLSRLAAASDDSYATCLLKGVGLGGLTGVSTAIVSKLKDKKWADAAKLISKEAVKRGVKIGIKGGVAGLAAALGAFAVWCATPWA